VAGRTIGEALVLVGALFTLLAAVGMHRFNDVFIRMHALNKATTVGLLFAILGALVALHHPNDLTSLALAAGLHLVTSPIGTHVLARATYHAEGIPHGVDTEDELADGIRSGAGDRADQTP
jgi:multicomponent Na+:H+ antiporter subunit G